MITGHQSKSLRRWYPVTIKNIGSSLEVTWRFFGNLRFSHSTFEESLVSARSHEYFDYRTGPEALGQFDNVECIEPSAFIFHASRCGSTLFTQLLTALQQCVVISEAPIIDNTINLYKHSSSLGINLFIQVVRSLGQRRLDEEQHLFIKLDSWHITDLELIRQAFPITPFLFLYRHPSEIIRSHIRQRGMHMVPGLLSLHQLGIGEIPVDVSDSKGFCSVVLTSFFRSAVRHAKSGELILINYSQLPDFIWTQFLKWFSILLSPNEFKIMLERTSRHSKRSYNQFVGDENQSTGNMHVDSALLNCYNELEQYRLHQTSLKM